MARSKWKLSFFSISVWRRIIMLKKKKYLRRRKFFYDRASVIPACFIFYALKIHKGRRFRKLRVSKYNIGFKFGEFSYPRKPYHFPLKKSLKRKK